MFIGIDLGTTNSAITSFDGKEVRVWKDPQQQTDVTPSAIYINKHGDKYYGWKAYNNEPRAPENTAKLFKRLMGSNTKIRFESSGIEMTPEECSAEILHELFTQLYNGISVTGNEEKDEYSLMTRLAIFADDKEQVMRLFRSSAQYRGEKPNAHYEKLFHCILCSRYIPSDCGLQLLQYPPLLLVCARRKKERGSA